MMTPGILLKRDLPMDRRAVKKNSENILIFIFLCNFTLHSNDSNYDLLYILSYIQPIAYFIPQILIN